MRKKQRLNIAICVLSVLTVLALIYTFTHDENNFDLPFFRKEKWSSLIMKQGKGRAREKGGNAQLTTKQTAIASPGGKKKMVQKLPAAIVIGVNNCNTRLLSDILEEHSQVSIAPATNYFNEDDNYSKGYTWYLEQVGMVPEDNIVIEIGASYYSSREAPARVRDLNPKTKLIFMACDPVRRALGHYRTLIQDPRNKERVESEITALKSEVNENKDFISESIYSKHINRWLEFFPKEQLFSMDDDDLKSETDKTLADLEDFLGITHKVSNNQIYYDEKLGTNCGRFDGGRTVCFALNRFTVKPGEKVTIDPSVVEKLQRYFQTHNEAFYKTVGKKFRW